MRPLQHSFRAPLAYEIFRFSFLSTNFHIFYPCCSSHCCSTLAIPRPRVTTSKYFTLGRLYSILYTQTHIHTHTICSHCFGCGIEHIELPQFRRSRTWASTWATAQFSAEFRLQMCKIHLIWDCFQFSKKKRAFGNSSAIKIQMIITAVLPHSSDYKPTLTQFTICRYIDHCACVIVCLCVSILYEWVCRGCIILGYATCHTPNGIQCRLHRTNVWSRNIPNRAWKESRNEKKH